MRYIEFIIFDLDGTLVDSRKDIVNAVNFTLKNIGLKEKTIEEISSYIGTGVEDLIGKSLGVKKGNLFNKALSVFEEYYSNHSTDNSILYPNVIEVLEYFKNKRKVIATNRKRKFALLTLKTLGINYYFEDIIGGDDLACMKPSSCPLDRTINKFRMDKDKAIIVGDMHLDVLAGKEAGILTCGVTYGIGKREYIIESMPDFMIDNLLDLKKIIK
ncbi:MAG: HAD-IA family hydrolase [Candidatus Omnitrophica bacterium]|nr:HAD-IA family hydrolase [Candidatus Omnitrophota bacterium]